MIGRRLTSLTVLIALCASASAGGGQDNNKLRRQLQGDTSICGAEGDRAVSCGAINPARPQDCCAGLICGPGGVTCITPDAVPVCAAEGERAIECGINQVNRPELCCDGLGCDPVDKACKPGLTREPTAAPFLPIVDPDCAVDGERAQDCGADNPARPQSCCEGFICNPRQNVVNCIPADGTPTEPTEPTASPVVGATVEPTASPVFVATVEPTPAPVEVDILPPDTASDEPTPSPVDDGEGATVDPDATPEPTDGDMTAAPTDAPEPPADTMQPTSEPTKEPSTPAPSPPPTDDVPPLPPPPSSASSLTAQLALAACLFAPLLVL